MNKKFKIIFSIGSIALLTGCNLEVNPSSTAIMTAVNYEGETRIVYSLDDNNFNTPGSTEEGGSPSRHITKGDYKPVWSALQNRLGINLLEHQAAANSGSKKAADYFRDNWMTKTYADISMGTVYDINNYSVAGNRETILDLKPYLFDEQGNARTADDDPLPNIAKFLDANPGVKMSIITAKHSKADQGAIYYIPYFDGFNEVEKGTIIRADYVRRLLDDDPESTDSKYKFSINNKILGKEGSDATYKRHYEPCYVEDDDETAPTYKVTVPKYNAQTGDWDQLETFEKQGAKNIIVRQNELIDDNEGNSKEFAKAFRKYIDDRYGTPGTNDCPFKNYSDLFLGYNACYDADELVALMRLAKVSSGTIFKDKKGNEIQKEIVTMMPRVVDNMRSTDIYRWAGQTFGVRGPESRNMFLYIKGEKNYREFGYGRYGAVHDARGSEDMLWLLTKLKSLYQEGLILQDFDSPTATGTDQGKFADETLFSGGSDNFAGFMLYDYPKDLNDYNKYKSAERKKDQPCDWVTISPNTDPIDPDDNGYKYDLRAIVGAIAHWQVDPTSMGEVGYEWMPFTESWASLKTSALCLNAKLADNPEKLKATFKLVDYIYGPEGMILYNYGPWEDGYITRMAGDYGEYSKGLGVYSPDAKPDIDYIEYQGERFPMLTEKALSEFKGESGKTSYQRRYLGATIPFGFRKLSVVPYLTMEPNTRHGIDVINKAIQLETYKHVLIGGYTDQQKEDIKTPFYQICPSAFFLTKGQSSAISSLLDRNALGSMFSDSDTKNFSIWDALIMGGEARLGVTLENYLAKMKEWKVDKLETYYQDAFEIMSSPLEEETTK